MEFLNNLIGEGGAQHFLSLMFFALIGANVNLYLDVKKRDKFALSTPMKWDFWFMVLDNIPRALGSLLLMFAGVRFMVFIVPENLFKALPVGAEFFVAFLIGLYLDKVAVVLKKNNILLNVDRTKINKEK